MQKAVVPHRRQQLLEIEAFVFDSRGAPLRRAQKAFDLLFILGKEHSNDFLLVGEVVVQVARGNLHVGSDVVGADTALTLLVEQLQAVLHDAFAGLDTRGHDQLQRPSFD
ncbi:hypothetical protein D3C77_295060 [compost metagenome]